jgi:hypothetical protein
MPNRFVSFMDILGFGTFVESNDIKTVLHSLRLTLSMVPVVCKLGTFANDTRKFHITASDPKLHVFSFSDTFVLISEDDSLASFFQIVAGTSIFSSYLFAAKLPVRGAITCGEAEFIPGTSHLVGRAIIRAARLEKCQDWFGVLLDADMLSEDRRKLLSVPFLKPLVVQYDVPFKPGSDLRNPSQVINWRFNMVVESGTTSLFRDSCDPSHTRKKEHTLTFCRWLRASASAYGAVHDDKGQELGVPWLTGIWVGTKPPGARQAWHMAMTAEGRGGLPLV